MEYTPTVQIQQSLYIFNAARSQIRQANVQNPRLRAVRGISENQKALPDPPGSASETPESREGLLPCVEGSRRRTSGMRRRASTAGAIERPTREPSAFCSVCSDNRWLP